MTGPVEPRTGLTIADRYRLGRLLGVGSMGHVFRAADLQTNDPVAVKVLLPQLCTVRSQVRRFAREFELTAQVAHPNVVQVHCFGEETTGELAGTHYLVMELLAGRGLDEALKNGPLSPHRAVAIGAQVARALAAAHAHGVVHRDLKPQNIIVLRRAGQDRIKVMDFGLARLEGDQNDDLTDIGVRLGTAEYMAPEYVEAAELTASSDLYSLGILLYELLTGTPPFVGSSLKIMQDHVDRVPTPPSKRASGLPGWLEQLVVRLLAKGPDDRPESARIVADLLEEGLPSLAETATKERLAYNITATKPDTRSLPPMEGVLSHSEISAPVYPDPKPLPGVPIAVGLLLVASGIIGIGTVLGIVLILVFG